MKAGTLARRLRAWNLLLAGSLAFIAGALLTGCDRFGQPSFRLTEAPEQMPDLKLGLEDTSGEVRTARGLRGQAVLMYFGYTHCPDICPMTLSRIRQALGKLPDEQAKDVSVLFVTVDPERDTPKVMRRYVSGFNMPQLEGLIGKGEAFKALKKRFHIYVDRQKEGPDDTDYKVSHSSQVLIFDRQGDLRLFARLSGKKPDSAEAVAADLRKLL